MFLDSFLKEEMAFPRGFLSDLTKGTQTLQLIPGHISHEKTKNGTEDH